ncbi:hypothetical protein LC593_36260 [Nostoc sp. CHAB 5844]|nr:hypothetical protein [Nostoc sp. CHAB 5844]
MLTSCTIEILGKNFKPSPLLTPVATTLGTSLRVTLKSVANAALTQLPAEGGFPSALIHRTHWLLCSPATPVARLSGNPQGARWLPLRSQQANFCDY